MYLRLARYLVLYGIFQGVACQVVLIANDVRDIIALQLQHQLQVVAQVVLTQAEAQRLLGLHPSAYHAAGQAYLGLVPYAHAVQRLGERQRRAAILAYIAVALKGVTRLHHPQREPCPTRYA